MSRLKAALFDLDGVVFDTEPQYTEFWGAQCRELHPEHPGLEHEITGQTLVQIFDRHFSGELVHSQAIISKRLHAFAQTLNFAYIERIKKKKKKKNKKAKQSKKKKKTLTISIANKP